MKHQSRVIGHIERLAAQRDDGGDGCGDAVNVYGYVSLRCREGIEYRYAGEDLSAHGIDPYVNLPIDPLEFHQFRHHLCRAHLLVLSHRSIKEEAGGLAFRRYYVEKFLGHTDSFSANMTLIWHTAKSAFCHTRKYRL